MAAGLLLCFAWYFTIIAGFYMLYCPVMYIMFINHKLYRKVVDALFALWELYPVALFQCFFKTHLHHFGDYVDPDENTIIVMNHRTRVDWNYVWIGLYHATHDPTGEVCICKEPPDKFKNSRDIFDRISGGISKIKFVLKDELKNVPAMGWIMQLNFFLYVKRDWREDQLNMLQFVEYYKKLKYPCRLVLFPEGTDLSEDNKRRSDKFAAANNLPKLEYVLHPRTTGWVALCSALRGSGLNSVYDVTVAYDTPAQTEADLLRGCIPKHVYFYFKKYSIEQLPEDDLALKTWLNNRWSEKEISLKNFHKNGKFLDLVSNKTPKERGPRSLRKAKLAFLFWTIIDIVFIWGIFNSVILQFWVTYHSLTLVFVTWKFGGFQNVQCKLLQKLKI
ncbi:lysocardiolipin acyltransferase 1 [Amyelois transitella]|uniref:lysocardiolipin acyltransferase 1 n=1 Tax=Amyelois transitella TaxID=680683 RepID=UPI00067B90FB|nr:lysocardiolipin acyltransferase 1 [Amyelois transitella]